jgi:hypothetical protein
MLTSWRYWRVFETMPWLAHVFGDFTWASPEEIERNGWNGPRKAGRTPYVLFRKTVCHEWAELRRFMAGWEPLSATALAG